MKIVFFNRFFFPDASATSQILTDLAFHLAAQGSNVHVVTSKVAGGDAAVETINGVTVHRVANSIAGHHGLMRRALAYLSYYRGARKAARQLLSPGDVAVLKTDPPLLSAVVGNIARRRGARIIAWVQDVFPEIAAAFGVTGIKGVVLEALCRVRDQSLQLSHRVVVISDGMATRLIGRGIDSRKFTVIPNWADGNAVHPVPANLNPLRDAWNLHGKFVVAYCGNLGRVHEFDTMLQAAFLLREESDISFVIVGRGPRELEVQAKARQMRLSNLIFENPQDRSRLSQSLSVGDLHLSILQPRFESLVMPSKTYGIMAVARPIIFVGDTRGESARLVAAADCGASVESGDSAQLASLIVALRNDPERRTAMGRHAREYFEQRFSLECALRSWCDLLFESRTNA